MKYLFLDLDGTLINYQTQIAINRARSFGHKVILCTGCSRCELNHAILIYHLMV